jgi:hypothetical protein
MLGIARLPGSAGGHNSACKWEASWLWRPIRESVIGQPCRSLCKPTGDPWRARHWWTMRPTESTGPCTPRPVARPVE